MTLDSGSSELVSLADEQRVLDVVTSSVFKLWEAVNSLTRLRPTKRSRYRVTIFGSARVPPDHWVYRAVRAFMLRPDFPLASPGDMTIPVCVEDGPGILRVIREHHAAWEVAQERKESADAAPQSS